MIVIAVGTAVITATSTANSNVKASITINVKNAHVSIFWLIFAVWKNRKLIIKILSNKIKNKITVPEEDEILGKEETLKRIQSELIQPGLFDDFDDDND